MRLFFSKIPPIFLKFQLLGRILKEKRWNFRKIGGILEKKSLI